MAGQKYHGIFTAGVKSPADSRYDVRKDVLHPQSRQPLKSNIKVEKLGCNATAGLLQPGVTAWLLQ